MFTFSQGVDEDGNEENVVFCEINPIERILLNLRNLDEQLTFNCVYDVIKDPDKQLIFDNPEIRGVNGDVEIEGDFISVVIYIDNSLTVARYLRHHQRIPGFPGGPDKPCLAGCEPAPRTLRRAAGRSDPSA